MSLTLPEMRPSLISRYVCLTAICWNMLCAFNFPLIFKCITGLENVLFSTGIQLCNPIDAEK